MSKVLVCVTKQKTCKRLIDAGAELSAKLKAELFVEIGRAHV